MSATGPTASSFFRSAARVLVSSTVLATGATSRAETTDFLPENTNWNGLSAFIELARGLLVSVEPVSTLDWSDLSERDVLFFIHPINRIDQEAFVAFVRSGGRAVIADDFGAAADLLARLGITRRPARAIRAARYYLDNRRLPVATAAHPNHPLVEGVPYLLTNHPSLFRSRLPTLLGFASGQQLLVANSSGGGTFIALADPSVLINSMLRYATNLRFASNLLRTLCRPGLDRILILSGHFAQRGSPSSAGTERASAKRSPEARINDYLGRLNDFALTEASMRAIALVLAGVLVLILSLVLPLPRRPLSGPWFLGTRDRGLAEAKRRRSLGAVQAAMDLRRIVEARLCATLGADSQRPDDDAHWVRRTRQLSSPAVARELEAVMRALRKLPVPGANKARTTRWARRGALAGLYQRSHRLLRLLGSDGLAEQGETLPAEQEDSSSSAPAERRRGGVAV